MAWWEYHSCTVNLAQERSNAPDDQLNLLGADGWELVGYERKDCRLFCLLKRQKKFRRHPKPRATD